MYPKEYYPFKKNIVISASIAIFVAVEWYMNPNISILLACCILLSILILILINLRTYKVEIDDDTIKFYRLFQRMKELRWTVIKKFDYDKDGYLGRDLFIYFLIDDQYHRFNINLFNKSLLYEIINQCTKNAILVRDTSSFRHDS